MAVDLAYGQDRPVAQLALGGEYKAAVEAWFSEEGLRYTTAGTDVLGLPAELALISAEPVILHLSCAALTNARTLDALTGLAARTSIIAILDAEMVDVLPPYLDVDAAEYVAWPCGKEIFMSVLQQIGLPSFKERAESYPINPEILRDEIDRIAKALSALAESTNIAQPQRRSNRNAQESAQLIRNIIRRRRARAQFFPADLFADPAWDILLDLSAARLEGARVSISSLCIAASVPTTTALRWIKGMTGAHILEREGDPEDGRRSFVRLSDKAVAAMEHYLTLVDEGVV